MAVAPKEWVSVMLPAQSLSRKLALFPYIAGVGCTRRGVIQLRALGIERGKVALPHGRGGEYQRYDCRRDLAKMKIVGKEEQFVLLDRTSDQTAVLIAVVVRTQLSTGIVQERVRVQILVFQVT